VTPRLRFAPSPTGYLHVGGARTALFNWLYARRHGGAFILRIEDTDVERSQAELVTGILDGLRWLGIDWDEGPETGGPHAPYFQSQRLDRYRAAAKQLLDSGYAFEDGGAIRFRVPPGKTSFTDSVHGPIEFDNEHIESFVILRSDTHPTYHSRWSSTISTWQSRTWSAATITFRIRRSRCCSTTRSAKRRPRSRMCR